MRDAEEIFEREVARLQAARTRDDVSYRTASEGGVVGGLGPPPLHDEGNRPQPPPPTPPLPNLQVKAADGLVLLTVLNKIAEAVGKAGAQASFRISSVRQELQVDVRPHLAKIKQFSEYLQAEAEELSLATALKTSSTTNAANPTQQAPGLKALATSGTKDAAAETGDQKKRSFGAPCRFWGTDGGCKKGSSCSYAHSWDGLKKNNRCFGCSGVGHSKRDCPVKKWDWGTSKTTAAAAPKVSKRMEGLLEKALAQGWLTGLRGGGVPGGHRSDSQHRTAEFGGHGWRNT